LDGIVKVYLPGRIGELGVAQEEIAGIRGGEGSAISARAI
jgi:hypothetical protein